MHSPKRIKITDVNPHLICVLCGGYYIDATTIIECLHSFCKSCIVRYLQKNKYCPICDVQVHKTAPLLNIRSDTTLQNIVYKLVPSLFKNEMERRVTFYEKYPTSIPTIPEQRGEVTDTTSIFFPDELLIICLEYQMDKNAEQLTSPWPKRYLHCPAALTVSHLIKLIRGKFGLSHLHHVSLFFKEDLLQDDFTIMDIAYTYQCRRKMPIHLMYRILELKKKTIRLMPPIPPPMRSETATQSENLDEKCLEELKKKDIAALPDNSSKSVQTKEEETKKNNVPVLGKKKVNLVPADNHINVDKKEEKNASKYEVEMQETKSNIDDKSLHSSKHPDELQNNDNTEGKRDSAGEENVINNEESKIDKGNLGKSLKETNGDKSSITETEQVSEGEWKEVQLQISENGVMSVRNMKSIECSPIPAVEAPNCPVTSHPSTTSQANSTLVPSKLSYTSNVQQSRSSEPIVSVSKVNKDEVLKKEVNSAVIPCENKLSISRVYSSIAATVPVAKGDVLNRIVSKLSPNETVIGNTGVTIRPVTKVYPGMKSLQKRKSRVTSNHLQTRYKTAPQTPTWNPTIDRATMITLKQNCVINKPPRFFKIRNTPRYLGNPAEGVKPIYGSGRQEESSPKQSPPKSPVKQPPPYTPRGQDKPPPPYTPRPAHTGCGGAATTYPLPNPYHLLYSGFPFSGASPELLRSMCASTAYHPSLPPSISMLYNNPGLQQSPQRSPVSPLPTAQHDFKVTSSPGSTPPSIQRIPSSLSPKPLPQPPSIDDKKRDPSPASSSSSTCPLGIKPHKSPLDDKPPSLALPPTIPLPPPSHPISDKSPTTTALTNNNNTKESLLSNTINQQHPLK